MDLDLEQDCAARSSNLTTVLVCNIASCSKTYSGVLSSELSIVGPDRVELSSHVYKT
jgi:hypothetical protein